MNKIKNKLIDTFKGDSKKIKIIVAIGLIGMILIFVGDNFEKKETVNSEKENSCFDYNEYTCELENKLIDVISSIDGVGNCKVMLTLENTTESVYATDNESKFESDSSNIKDEYVFYDSGKGKSPVLIKEYLPKVMGVTVVCSGGDDDIVRERIIDSVTALFNIPANRVAVSKIIN